MKVFDALLFEEFIAIDSEANAVVAAEQVTAVFEALNNVFKIIQELIIECETAGVILIRWAADHFLWFRLKPLRPEPLI
jgi:hypothetical protein